MTSSSGAMTTLPLVGPVSPEMAVVMVCAAMVLAFYPPSRKVGDLGWVGGSIKGLSDDDHDDDKWTDGLRQTRAACHPACTWWCVWVDCHTSLNVITRHSSDMHTHMGAKHTR